MGGTPSPSKPPPVHPYLAGNFAPVFDEYVEHPCEVVHGAVPDELLGGQYIRNGGNPVNPPEAGRDYHWFDGDGMLHGVFFPSTASEPPRYTNRALSTQALNLSLLLARTAVPSIALLIGPLNNLHRIATAVVHTLLIALEAGVGTLSVANTNVLWWGSGLGEESEGERSKEAPATGVSERKDGRLLALCESGPPLEVRVPALETVDWDKLQETDGGASQSRSSLKAVRRGWGWKRWGLGRIQDDWMTAHPRVDPINGDLVFYQCQMFEKPYVRYSVMDRHGRYKVWKFGVEVGRAKMMHDFACTRSTTIILNLPLTLSPLNLLSFRPKPLIHFDRSLPSDFVLLPRDAAASTVPLTFREAEPSMIFHTANAWDETAETDSTLAHGDRAVDMVACRFDSAKLVYAAGAVPIPLHEAAMGVNDVVRLHYYRFLFAADGSHRIAHSFPLSAIPFEFPNVHPAKSMSRARYIYGCTMREGGFDERLGGAAKVDCLVKVDVLALAERGRKGNNGKKDAVSETSVMDILRTQERGERDGLIQVFPLPEGWFAQEGRFVPRQGATAEDDGYLLSYVYDESYILADGTASVQPGTGSELWVLDASKMAYGMQAVVCRIKLPQRVPYGLHGTFVPASQSKRQRDLPEPLPAQIPLTERIYRSRLAQVIDIVFTRPYSRHKSRAEQIAFAVLFPLGWIALLMAMIEGVRQLTAGTAVGHAPRGEGSTGWSSGMLDDLTVEDALTRVPWPQTLTAVFVLGTLGYYW